MFEHRFTVAPEDVDKKYGHVHHAHILRYLELARLEFLKDRNYPADMLIESGLLPVIVKVTISYDREIVGESYTVTVDDCVIKGRTIMMNQRIVNDKQKVMVEASVHSMLFDHRIKRAVRPTPQMAADLAF